MDPDFLLKGPFPQKELQCTLGVPCTIELEGYALIEPNQLLLTECE